VTISVVGVAVALRERDSTGSLDVALLNITSFVTYTRLLVVVWSETETALGAVSRIKVLEKSMDPDTSGVSDAVGTSLQPSPTADSIVFDDVLASREGRQYCGIYISWSHLAKGLAHVAAAVEVNPQ